MCVDVDGVEDPNEWIDQHQNHDHKKETLKAVVVAVP